MNIRHRFTYIWALTVICLIASTVAPPPLPAQSGGTPPQQFASDRVLVACHPGTAASEIGAAHNQAGGRVVKTMAALGVQVVAVPTGQALSAVRQYQRNPNVRYAEPYYRRPLFRPVTNEGSEPGLGILNNFNEQYGLHNTGQSFGATVDPLFGILTAPAFTGAADADIDAPEGWDLTHGSADIKIAILDSGISCSHVDLDGKCVEQVNFVGEHGSPVDDILGHGTHVAAIAAAKTDNGVGIAGVARNASIGSLKVCYEDYSLAPFGIIQGYCEDDDIAEAITYAADNGYHVINMSLAGPQLSLTLQNAVNYAWNNGLVLVAASGNDYSTEKRYPAAYENVIAVAATDYFDNLAYFSTFSKESDDWVSVVAPGHVVFSAVPSDLCGLAPNDPEGCYDWKSGTSMSTPQVAGIAAMLWAYLPSPTNEQVRDSIENSAEAVGALGQNFLAWTRYGRVNLYEALMYSSGGPGPEDTTPPVISSISSSKANGVFFEVSWHTDEPATSLLIIPCCGDVSDAELVTEHKLRFRGKKGVAYEFYVSSIDAAGNEAIAGPFTHQN